MPRKTEEQRLAEQRRMTNWYIQANAHHFVPDNLSPAAAKLRDRERQAAESFRDARAAMDHSAARRHECEIMRLQSMRKKLDATTDAERDEADLFIAFYEECQARGYGLSSSYDRARNELMESMVLERNKTDDEIANPVLRAAVEFINNDHILMHLLRSVVMIAVVVGAFVALVKWGGRFD